MKRLLFVTAAVAALAIGLGAQGRARDDNPNVSFRARFNVVEATIPDMQAVSRPAGNFLPTAEEVAAAPLQTFDREFELVREEGVWRVDMKPLGISEAPVDKNMERVRAAADQEFGSAEAGGTGH